MRLFNTPFTRTAAAPSAMVAIQNLHIIVLMIGFVNATVVVYTVLFWPGEWSTLQLLIPVAGVGVCGVLWLPFNAGYVRWVRYGVVALVAVTTTLGVVSGGGAASPVYSYYILLIMIAGLLFGIRAGLLGTAFALGLGAAFTIDPALAARPQIPDFPRSYTFLLQIGLVGQTMVLTVLFARQAAARTVELERTKTRLDATQQRYRLIAENSKDMICLHAADGTYLYVSPSAQEIVGYSPMQLLGQDPYAYFHPNDRSMIRETSHDVTLETGTSSRVRYRYQHAEGHYVWLESTSRPIFDDNGKVINLVTVTRDISTEIQMEAALSASEKRYREMIENANQGVWLADEQGMTTYVNQHMAWMLGHDTEDMVGRPVKSFMDVEWQTIAEDNIERRRQGIAEILEFRFKHRDGRNVWGLVSTVPLHDESGFYTGAQSFISDITELYEVQLTLVSCNKQMRMLRDIDRSILRAESIEDTALAAMSPLKELLKADLIGTLLFNHDASALTLLAGDKVGRADKLDVSDNPGLIAALRSNSYLLLETPPGGTPTTSAERLMYSTGMQLTLAVPLRHDETLLGIIALGYTRATPPSQDQLNIAIAVADQLTIALQQGLLREQITAANRELEQRVEERTAALERTNRELESFTYSVSHDLRAPVRAVRGFAEMLREDLPTDHLTEEVAFSLRRIQANAVRMDELIDGLLQLSRLGRRELSLRTLQPGVVVQEVLHHLREDGELAQCKVTCGPLPPCYADYTLLRVLFENLIGNAVKYSATTADPAIHIGSHRKHRETVYFVRDNGVGFDMDYADKLFTPFQRLHGDEFEGTGIGLATVQRVVERLGGRVWAESAPGAGATFFFTVAGQ